MTNFTRYKDTLAQASSSLEYWREIPMNEFAIELGERMEQLEVSRAELARRLGSSQAYVTKVLGGNVNFTIETMAKLAMALGGALHIHISQQDAVTHWLDDVKVTSDQASVFRLAHLEEVKFSRKATKGASQNLVLSYG